MIGSIRDEDKVQDIKKPYPIVDEPLFHLRNEKAYQTQTTYVAIESVEISSGAQ